MRSRYPKEAGSSSVSPAPPESWPAGEERLIRYFVRRYPARSAALVALLLGAGVAEGFGFLTLLPLLEVAVDGAAGRGVAARAAATVLTGVGAPVTAGTLLALIVGALWLKGLFRWLAMRQVGYMVARVARDLRERFAEALLAARWGHLGRERAGEIATAVSRDAFWAAHGYRNACAGAAALIEAGAYAGVVMVVSWRLGALALVGAGLLAWLMGVFIRMSRRAGVEQTVRARDLVSRLLDVVGVVKAVKAMGRERGYADVLRRGARSLERSERRQVLAAESLHAFREPLVALLVAPVVLLVLARGMISVPTLLVAILLLYRLMGRLHQVQAEYQGVAASEGAFRALDRQAGAAESAREVAGGTRAPPALEHGIALRDVAFDHGRRRVLEGIDLDIPAGRITALAGRSGVGKSTILDLLLALQEPAEGEILVDGVPLSTLDRAAWRARIGYVPQESVLLNDTVAHNVALGAASPRADELETALRRAGAWEFVATLPEGLDTVVGERGASLSGGERQRLALARALLGAPRLLILDEATSELDAPAAAAIWRTLRALRGEVTIVAASHDLAVRDAADVVYDVVDGRVVGRRSEAAAR